MPRKVLTHFKKYDSTLHKAIITFDGEFRGGPKIKKELFASLCRTIAGQQLSGSAADAIWNKFRKMFNNGKPTAKGILKMSDEELRESGFSYAKIRSLKDLSARVRVRSLRLPRLKKLSVEQASEQLQKVIGIGPWTTEMFLMFALGNEDIFSAGDLGLKKGIQRIYNLKTIPTPDEIMLLSERWSPYRTYAACAIWTILDNR